MECLVFWNFFYNLGTLFWFQFCGSGIWVGFGAVGRCSAMGGASSTCLVPGCPWPRTLPSGGVSSSRAVLRAVKDSHRRAASGQASYMETLRPDSEKGNENCQSLESWACQLVQYHFCLILQVKQSQNQPGFHSGGHRPHLFREQ